MSQCVPNWDLDENTNSARLAIHGDLNAESTPTEETMLDYEVAELTWENGQLAMHGLGPPRVTGKPTTKYAWEKPRAGGTLESIVNQATCVPPGKTPEDLVLWLDHHRATANLAMDALVPCSNRTHSADENSTQVPDQDPTRGGAVGQIGSWVGSCSGVVGKREEAAAATAAAATKRTRVASSLNQSVSGSETVGRESRQVTVDTWEMDTSLGSHENTSSRKPLSSRTQPTTIDDHDSVSRSRPQKEAGSEDENKGKTRRCSISTKRSRAAAIHNQSERKRRDRINQRMKTLQKLVPNSSKTDKASMLDEVIEYLKQLQAQVQMMTKMSSIPHMMMPMTMQQLQLSMMAQMGMGVGMGMGMGVMDINSMNRSGHAATAAAIPSMIHPAAFLPMTASWDTSGDRLQASSGVLLDPFATFLACQTRQQQQQPMNLETYNRMAALYQQLQNQFTQFNSKS